MRAIDRREAQLARDFPRARAAYEEALELHDAARKKIIASKQDDVAKRNDLSVLGPPPEPPPPPCLTCEEPTFEGLARVYAEGARSLGLFSSEGGQFVGGFGMAKEQRLRTATALSSLWDGRPIKRVRAGDGVAVLHGKSLALHLMVQPQVAENWLADAMLLDQGLLSRLLIAAPESLAGHRRWREADPSSEADLDRFAAMLDALFDHAERRDPERRRALSLEPGARSLWIDFVERTEARHLSDLAPIGGFAAKLAEHAARLAGLFALADDPAAATIGVNSMTSACAIAEFYAAEALRLTSAPAADAELVLARSLLDWLIRRGAPEVGLTEIYQRGPNRIRSKAAAVAAMRILEEHRWVVASDDGRRFRLHPKALEQDRSAASA